MHIPSVDIIVPVWNSPFETRACLAAIIEHSPEARLIIVDNGSNRETELMLEEFSEPIGERGLFIKSERNIGMVPAINMGLARSDSDFAVVLRPHVLVTAGWLGGLLAAARSSSAGIVSPKFAGKDAPILPPLVRGSSLMDTFEISFTALVLKGEMQMLLGGFDEAMDSGYWCLRDYVRRAWSRGYRTCVTSDAVVACGKEILFGSDERRQQQTQASRTNYLARWGIGRHYCIYFGPQVDAASLNEKMEIVLEGARRGHRFVLLLHRRQYGDFQRMGWHSQHQSIQLSRVGVLMPQRAISRTFMELKAASPDIVPVRGLEGDPFPGIEASIPFSEVAAAVNQ